MSSPTAVLLSETVRRLLAGAPAAAGPAVTWQALEDAGLTLLGVDAATGGSGGNLEDILVVLSTAAQQPVDLPLAESLLASAILAEAGQVRTGSLAVATPRTLGVDGGTGRITGAVEGVAWADAASTLVLLVHDEDHEVALLVPRSDYTTEPGRNLAGEPRDRVVLDTTAHVVPVPPGAATRHARRTALLRSFQMTGAADRALDLTIMYAKQREQFGRPIGKFQAVQQQIALSAGEAAALREACISAARTCGEGRLGQESALLPVAACKVQAGVTAAAVSRVAHQIHGAVGLTVEHPLHRATTRLWAWRDEGGDERTWAAELADAVLGVPDLWTMMTDGA